jgi:hypothetical protein
MANLKREIRKNVGLEDPDPDDPAPHKKKPEISLSKCVKLFVALRRMCPERRAAAVAEIPYSTIHSWLQKARERRCPPIYKAFARAWHKSIAEGMYLAIVRLHVTGNSADIRWLLSKRFPEEFGDKVGAPDPRPPTIDDFPDFKVFIETLVPPLQKVPGGMEAFGAAIAAMKAYSSMKAHQMPQRQADQDGW